MQNERRTCGVGTTTRLYIIMINNRAAVTRIEAGFWAIDALNIFVALIVGIVMPHMVFQVKCPQ